MAPQAICPMARAKLMATIPMPVELSTGLINSPNDWRVPMVIIRIPAAARVTTSAPGCLNERNIMAPFCRALLYPGFAGFVLCHAFLDAPLRINRSEEHTSELQSLMRISYAVFCL